MLRLTSAEACLESLVELSCKHELHNLGRGVLKKTALLTLVHPVQGSSVSAHMVRKPDGCCDVFLFLDSSEPVSSLRQFPQLILQLFKPRIEKQVHQSWV